MFEGTAHAQANYGLQGGRSSLPHCHTVGSGWGRHITHAALLTGRAEGFQLYAIDMQYITCMVGAGHFVGTSSQFRQGTVQRQACLAAAFAIFPWFFVMVGVRKGKKGAGVRVSAAAVHRGTTPHSMHTYIYVCTSVAIYAHPPNWRACAYPLTGAPTHPPPAGQLRV